MPLRLSKVVTTTDLAEVMLLVNSLVFALNKMAMTAELPSLAQMDKERAKMELRMVADLLLLRF